MTAAKLNEMRMDEFISEGFATIPFPKDLQAEMLKEIEKRIRQMFAAGPVSDQISLKQLAMNVPDDVWSKKMHRGMRIFSEDQSEKIHQWADRSIRVGFGRERSVVNAVTPYEISINPQLSEKSRVIYWRCVRPGKPDAGRPHRDSTFWAIEVDEGYDPKIPFPFDYVKDCIKLWIPLQGCSPRTTLQVIPRSHQMDIPTEVIDTEYGRKPTLTTAWLKEHEKEFMSPIALSQDSCIIFDNNLVHRGPTHQESELRISAELTLIVQ